MAYARALALPFGFARIYINNVLYYRYNDIYYQPYHGGGYVVVNTPPTVIVNNPQPVVVAQPNTPAPAPVPAAVTSTGYQTILVDGSEYKFRDGQFFQPTADGLIWVPAPLGALTPSLPADAISVWYQDIEYFDCDGVYFRKTPNGYLVVTAPWQAARDGQ